MENQVDLNQPVQISEKPKINYWRISTMVLFAVVIFLLGYSFLNLSAQNPKDKSSEIATSEQKITASPTPSFTEKVYRNNTFGVSMIYPNGWFGPEIYESKDGFSFEVGTDKVYPYGTGREDRIYEKKNSYYLTVEYAKKPIDRFAEEYRKDQPWLEQYLPLFSLKDGETKTYQGIVFTKIRQLSKGDFRGVEYTVSLSPINYFREVLFVNDNYDKIRIVGSPNNVSVVNKSEWKTAFQQIDGENLAIFRDFVDSISL